VTTAARIVPYVWYPAGMAAAVIVFAALLAANAPLLIALYGAIVVVALALLWLQRRFPERPSWRPARDDVKTDLAFMTIVQVALPQALAAAFALALAQRFHDEPALAGWPRHWAVPAQMALMLIIVDFFRYWLHRACHRFPPLWRLHEVHHSPPLLYSLNSGRFHPLEKALHLGVDTLPFLAVGVAPEVMAGYFLLYAANGLFQHANVRLRYGWLNYIVGSAETHRWHHARDPRAGACNYGTTTVVWDVVFGTWRLPPARQLGEVGIMDKDYPKDFAQQLGAPFRDLRPALRWHAAKRALANILIRARIWATLLVQGWRIARAVRDPMRTQNALLERILRVNRDTAFGRRYGFAECSGYAAFARRVPVADYEALRPYIDAEIERGEHALTEAPAARYVRTSGSTGQPKDIPLTSAHLEALRRIHETAVAFQYRECPEAFAGSILAIVSPAYEGLLQSGKPFGSASGIVAGSTPATVREKFVLPLEVSTVADARVKYLLILRLALACPDITCMGTANSTTLLALIDLYREHWPRLIEDVRDGTFLLADALPADVASAIRSRLEPCPGRATELATLHARLAKPRVADLWPALRAVVTWTCGSAGTAVSALRHELSPRTRVLELGYVASEFRATITLGHRAGAGLPTLDTHFFEFVERDRWDRGDPEFLTLDRVRKGVDYYIVVTTPSGLYRYFINDLVRVTGFLHGTPLLRFVQKGRGVTNITGEKLYESQVLDAVSTAMAEMGCALRFVMMLADEEARTYRLYVEPDAGPMPATARLARAVDAKLALLNLEYRAKRDSDRLRPIEAHWLRARAGDAYKAFCVARGQREGQFKPAALAYRRSFGFDVDRFVAA
jgi:sterol desaturase/sphingolipid hydroxylase (fatty acid hydroxylase superfamily)